MSPAPALKTCDACAVELYEDEVELCRRCGAELCEDCRKEHECPKRT